MTHSSVLKENEKSVNRLNCCSRFQKLSWTCESCGEMLPSSRPCGEPTLPRRPLLTREPPGSPRRCPGGRKVGKHACPPGAPSPEGEMDQSTRANPGEREEQALQGSEAG